MENKIFFFIIYFEFSYHQYPHHLTNIVSDAQFQKFQDFNPLFIKIFTICAPEFVHILRFVCDFSITVLTLVLVFFFELLTRLRRNPHKYEICLINDL